MFREFTKNPLWIHYLLRDFTRNSSIFSRIHYTFCELPIDLLSASRFFYEFTICSANSRWINYIFRDFTINSLSHYENTICYAYSRRIHYKFPIFFAISLGIHYLLREFTMNTLSISRIHLESTFFRKMTMNNTDFSRRKG